MTPAARVRRLPWPTILLLVLSLLGGAVAQAEDGRRVRLQLKWRHQFQFAGYYVAAERGLYTRAGLDVEIVAAKPGVDAIEEVLSGRAQYGVASSELALAYAQEKPVVVLGVVFQHSPLTLFARRSAGIESVHDLPGKRVAIADSEAELFAYFQRESVPRTSMKFLPHEFSVDALVAGRVDAIAGYDTDESYSLRDDANAYVRLVPRSSGLDFYGDTLFSSRGETEANPEDADAFRAASFEGWKWALEHPAETVELIHSKYAPDLPREKLLFEAGRTQGLVRADLVELGYSHPGRWHHIVQSYADVGMLAHDRVEVDLAGFVLPPHGRPMDPWLLRFSVLALLGALVVASIAWRLYRMNRMLQGQLTRVEGMQTELRQLALHDPLTGLHNRRAFEEAAERELARAKREKVTLGLALIDLDHFKQLNDTAGHAAGDTTLRRLASLLSFGRATDLPCRIGGEEFVVVMPHSTAPDVARVAARWLATFSQPDDDGRQITFSVGVAAYPLHGHTIQELLEAADKALYEAKAAGRARVKVADVETATTPDVQASPLPGNS